MLIQLTMFQRLTKGNNTWCIEVNDNIIQIKWGRMNGKQQHNQYVIDEGKQGRTPTEQAHFVAKSHINKKKKDGYHDENSESCAPLPMLAKNMPAEMKDTVCTIQPKLDGIRCMGNPTTGQLWSRRQTRIIGLDHISEEMTQLRKLLPTQIEWLDGELYNHTMNFNTINSLVRRTTDLTEKSLDIEYWIYDCIDCTPYTKRYETLYNAIHSNIYSFKYIKLIPCHINSPTDIISEKHNEYTKLGYEGLIIRTTQNGYDIGKRSSQLLKLKQFHQEEYIVIGFKQKQTINGCTTLGSIELKGIQDESIRFHSTPAMTFEERQRIWDNKQEYLGQIATVKFFEKTPKNIPRFPQLLGFRHPDDL